MKDYNDLLNLTLQAENQYISQEKKLPERQLLSIILIPEEKTQATLTSFPS